MEQFYLFEYLKNSGDIHPLKLELLKNEFDNRIYYYGDHFRCPFIGFRRKNINRFVKEYIKKALVRYFVVKSKGKFQNTNILSNAYFTINKELSQLNYNPLSPIHNGFSGLEIGCEISVLDMYFKINERIKFGTLMDLISKDFFCEIDCFAEKLSKSYCKLQIRALIVPNDVNFFDQLNLQIFKKLNKPSFIFLHGLPARYNVKDENGSDYLIVWGHKIKENFVNVGFNPDKILISGHPLYKSGFLGKLRNSLDNILILSKTPTGSQHRDKVRLQDRGNSIVYLLMIQKVLKSVGIKKVKLRVHPSENILWYYNFIERDFFINDFSPLNISLSKATLVIGPTSTVFIEAIYYGVNYLVFEPHVGAVDLMGYTSVPPFEEINKKVPISRNEDELRLLLRDKALLDSCIFNEYVDTPFSLSFIKSKLND